VWWDIQQLSLYVHGDLEPFSVVDEFPHPDYKEVIDADISRSIERSNTRLRPRTLAVDTEGVIGNVWGLSYASEAGRARVVRSVQSAALQESSRLVSGTGRVIFHNALYDVPILSELGIEVDWSRVEDTMLMLFCLRLLPLGLKPNGRRLAGVPMQSYDDVIRPAERRLALSYIKRAIDAKRCAVCGGTGKVAETRRVTDPNCDLCLGFGRISGAKKHTTKFCSCSKSTDACTACIDGGLWPARAGQPKYHWDTGVWSISTGWEIGRYLRKLQEDIEKGTFDDPDSDADEDSVETEGNERKPRTIRDRWKSWDDDVRGPVEELLGPMPEPTLDDIPSDDAIQYSARDADVTLRIYPKVSAMIDSMDLRRAYRIDLSVIPAAAEIQRNGMLVDCDKLLRLAKRLRRENDEILHQLRRACGRPINPASGDQVAALLFGERKLTYTDEDKVDFEPTFSFDLQSEKLTKSGRRASTDDKVLEGLKLKYSDREDIVSTVQLILDYRTRHKLVTTYAEKIPRLVDKEGRVHTRIRPTTAATFRWASGDPINLQNIPVRNKGGADLGRLIRECFIAPDGFVLSSADYEQVELRVLAALSGDGELLRAFIEGRDPHIIGAARAWSMSYDEIYEGRKAGVKKYADIRESSKNLNFGIVFGITPRGLQAQMELRGMKYTLEECADLIRMWIREVFPGIGDYIEETVSFARQHGYVRSLMGHIRYCPGVWSQINGIREAAEREAVNFRIQCTAAEVLKMGLADLWNKGKKTLDRVGTSLLMSIHDENLFQVRDTEVSRSVTATTVETFMMNPVDLPNGVKITTSMKFAVNWARLK
jgi:DNA polymerase I-like protein with 3'-5' exonuclease and polymerase domains